ncbi:GAF domain-containing protein [Cupriavidus gilardii]|uniref:GAF domain-containing protein n=1 Tax=Cupriavidus gilardii TaxID=82541 RepID=UPI001572B5FE|nr:GAF domain-containing protein [Cupriavidus gilardii]NSX05730.1 GAF domain-containing protein [Cupriavidus gilardii]
MSEAANPQQAALSALQGRLTAAQVVSLKAGLARPDHTGALFDAVGDATLALLGPGLLTINVWRADSREVVRQWSSDPDSYPVGGSKRKGDTPWARQLLERAEAFVGEGDEALAQVFDDIPTIRALGLRAVVNVPISERGRCIGTFNYLSPRSAWQADEVQTLRQLALLAAPAVAHCHAGGAQAAPDAG